MKVISKYLPHEWEFLSLCRTTALNMYLLLLVLIVVLGWKAGLLALCFAWLIDYVGILIARHQYSKKEQEFRNYINSGLKPYLVYAVTDQLGTRWKFVVDDKFSTWFGEIKYTPLVFDKQAVHTFIVFLSDKQKKEFEKEVFDSGVAIKKFYKQKISCLPLYVPMDKNMAVIKEVLKDKKLLEDMDYVESFEKKTSKSLSKGRKK